MRYNQGNAIYGDYTDFDINYNIRRIFIIYNRRAILHTEKF